LKPAAGAGTQVLVAFGPGVPRDDDALAWARTALRLVAGASTYQGKPPPYWFDADSFHELCLAAGERSVRALVAELDGCTGARAGQIAAGYQQRRAADLTRGEA